MVGALKLTPPKPKARRRKMTEREKIEVFSIPGALELADQIFEGPCQGTEPRIPGEGELVQRFVLPLQLCKTTNALLSMMQVRSKKVTPKALAAALEKKIFDKMWLQHPGVRAEPLPGRPMLRIVRFSSVEMDEAADGMKLARDLLRCPTPSRWDDKRCKVIKGKRGFGFLRDDAPRFVRTVRWWERVPPGQGFGLLEIWDTTR